jgi:hypothetical protein
MFYEEDNGFSIADRTISLQYRQFRTPRKELKRLICNNKKTYLLSEDEIQKYEKYLKADLNGNSNEYSNTNILNFKEIHVDIEGFSIEIAKKLGNNYLRNNCILVSTMQIECDSIRDSYFSKYARKIFNTHRNTIGQILTGEAIIGAINQKDINLLIDNPENLFNIEIVFDTPNNAISKLKNIRKDERILLENDAKLKDRAFLKNLLQNIEDVSVEHGSLDRIPDKDINLNEKVDFNKLHLNGTNGEMSFIDVYCLRSTEGTNIFVYFVNNDILSSTDNAFSFNGDEENYMNDDLIILNGKDIESLNVLIELGMVGYNPYLGLERAANMIIRNRIENPRENINGLEQNLFDPDRDEKIPEKAKELLEAVKLLVENNKDKDLIRRIRNNPFTNLGKIKICMTYPLVQNEILYELLTRMENDEYKSCYMDTEKFLQTVSNMNDEQLGEFMEKILGSLEFIEENNTVANTWLMENKKNVCKNLGIIFV